MAISMKVNGKTIKLTAKEFIGTEMVHLMSVNGFRICSMALESKNGMMLLLIKGTKNII